MPLSSSVTHSIVTEKYILCQVLPSCIAETSDISRSHHMSIDKLVRSFKSFKTFGLKLGMFFFCFFFSFCKGNFGLSHLCFSGMVSWVDSCSHSLKTWGGQDGNKVGFSSIGDNLVWHRCSNMRSVNPSDQVGENLMKDQISLGFFIVIVISYPGIQRICLFFILIDICLK